MTETATDRGGWISTFTGKKFFPCDPRPEDLDIEDIAHALANVCRFTGHVRRFYSVGQHSLLVMHWVRGVLPLRSDVHHTQHGRVLLTALLHDASEAYLCDVARPVKRSAGMEGYRAIEAKVEAVIAERFGLMHPLPEVVKQADEILLVTEARDLVPAFGPDWQHWAMRDKAMKDRIHPRGPADVKADFLAAYHAIVRGAVS